MKKLVFNKYSEYYDLIYEDKNYKKEVKYIDELIQKLHPGAKTILDIGCGTGIHANLLASLGYKVLGVDFSEQMIQIANSKKLIEYKENHDLLEFKTGDIRKIDLHDKFDVVVSLFHVISYLNSNQDLNDGLNTIYKHLKPGGVAIFDFWHGPGVLTDPPATRLKIIENNSLKITRIAVPTIDVINNTVEVKYDLIIYDKQENNYYELNESHNMRYYFKTEFDLFLTNYEIKDIVFYDWLTNNKPNLKSWTACIAFTI